MNEDCYFEIGHSHTICEDYALTGKINDDISYAIVCDGCSSSNTVDVGARILAHSAKEYLCSRYKGHKEIPTDLDAYGVGLSIITRASPHMAVLMLPYTALDATLLINICWGTQVLTLFYGDGGMLFKSGDKICYKEVEFPSGAPFYLSYLLEPDREEAYKAKFDLKAIIKYYNVNDDTLEEADEKNIENISTSDFYNGISGVSDFDGWASIMSDGIKTYQTTDKFGIKQDQLLLSSLQQISGYKGFKGKFVERRMKRMRQNCEKDGVTHYDDISVATIHMGEKNEDKS